MQDIKRLRAEVSGDPLAIGYAAMSDQEVADSMNAPTRTRTQPLDAGALNVWAMSGGRWARIDRARQGAGEFASLTDEARSVAIGVWRILERDSATVDLASPVHMGAVNALVDAAILTTSDRDALVALGSESISRAQEIGVALVRVGHVTNARA